MKHKLIYQILPILTQVFLTLIGIYLFMLILAFIGGWTNATDGCLKRPKNAEKIFFTYKLGCWMSGEQGKPYYWEELQ